MICLIYLLTETFYSFASRFGQQWSGKGGELFPCFFLLPFPPRSHRTYRPFSLQIKHNTKVEFVLYVGARAVAENEKWFLNFLCLQTEREMLIWFGKLFFFSACAHSQEPRELSCTISRTWRWLPEFSLLLFPFVGLFVPSQCSRMASVL